MLQKTQWMDGRVLGIAQADVARRCQRGAYPLARMKPSNRASSFPARPPIARCSSLRLHPHRRFRPARIARRVREAGVYSEIDSRIADEAKGHLSMASSPRMMRSSLAAKLGICYGQQALMHQLGGEVTGR
jgi:hypothetical protein